MRDSSFFVQGAELIDLPTVTVLVGKKKRTVLDLRATWLILDRCAGDSRPAHFLLESPVIGPAMRGRDNQGDGTEIAGQSVVTLANTFRLNGQIEAMLAVLAIQEGCSYELVNPQTWKRQMMPGEARDKNAARLKAIQLFPSVADDLKLVKHHNRAEALLLAEWGRRRG
jgi:hypothetical protein